MLRSLYKKFKLYELRESILKSWYKGELKETIVLCDEYLMVDIDYIIVLIKSLCLSAGGCESLAKDVLDKYSIHHDYDDIKNLYKKLEV